jgi:hypothetical protein
MTTTTACLGSHPGTSTARAALVAVHCKPEN